jgi:hypothetical protein
VVEKRKEAPSFNSKMQGSKTTHGGMSLGETIMSKFNSYSSRVIQMNSPNPYSERIKEDVVG